MYNPYPDFSDPFLKTQFSITIAGRHITQMILLPEVHHIRRNMMSICSIIGDVNFWSLKEVSIGKVPWSFAINK